MDAGVTIDAVTIKVRAQGPYKVTGPVKLIDHEGRPISTAGAIGKDGSIVLCRCGASSTKPFCDASHRAVAFDGDGVDPHSGEPGSCPSDSKTPEPRESDAAS